MFVQIAERNMDARPKSMPVPIRVGVGVMTDKARRVISTGGRKGVLVDEEVWERVVRALREISRDADDGECSCGLIADSALFAIGGEDE